MIYHLFEYLQEIGCDFPGIGLVKYITFRAMMAIMTALAVALYFGPKIIRKLQKLQIGEEIRDLGLEGGQLYLCICQRGHGGPEYRAGSG